MAQQAENDRGASGTTDSGSKPAPGRGGDNRNDNDNDNGHGHGHGHGDRSLRKPATAPHMRVLFTIAACLLRYLILTPVMAIRHLKQRISPAETHPTLTKTYPCRPKLPIRIFFPKSYDRQSPRPLPLLLSIHGGGFVVGEPADNDRWNSTFSQSHQALVIALNYAKAPAHPFPGPHLDLAALIAAVFSDQELTPHIDPAKVAIMGFSAGGSLTVSVSQVPAVREKVTAGIVPIYPVMDLSRNGHEKAPTRRYKPSLPGTRGGTKDPLASMVSFFDWAYIPVGQDLRDPLLSPFYAERSSLPRRIWLVGCELDMLGHEAWRAACRFSGKPVPGMDQPVGREEPTDGGKPGTLITEGDEAFAFDVQDQHGEVRWLCVPDAMHGFDMAEELRTDQDTREDGILKRDVLIRMTGEWLFGQP